MLIEVVEITAAAKTTLAVFNSFTEAKVHVEALGVVAMEDDADHANCADALMRDGRILSIQPSDFMDDIRDDIRENDVAHVITEGPTYYDTMRIEDRGF